MTYLLAEPDRDPAERKITPRQAEILQLLAEGQSNKEVARTLNLSVYTVETHRSNIMEKLDLHTTADIILYAVRKKLITP